MWQLCYGDANMESRLESQSSVVFLQVNPEIYDYR